AATEAAACRLAARHALLATAAGVRATATAGGLLTPGVHGRDLHEDVAAVADLGPDGVVRVLEGGAARVLHAGFLAALDEVAGDVDATAADGDVAVHDELARLVGRRGEAL